MGLFMRWTKAEERFLIDNYENMGIEYCCEHLNVARSKILNKTARLGLRLNKELFSNCKCLPGDKLRVNPDVFISNRTKESCYLLGYLWADGYLGSNYSIGLSIQERDALNIENTIQETGNWHKHLIKKRKDSWQNQIQYSCNSKVMFNFFKQYGWGNTYLGPCSLLSIIEEDSIKYWFRGYLDGDGCLYKNKKQYLNQLCFSGPYNQNWDFMKRLFTKLDINKYSEKSIVSKHSYSRIRICNKKDIISFGEYVYSGDLFGLDRKYNKFLEIRDG
jgi:hypothetical protein